MLDSTLIIFSYSLFDWAISPASSIIATFIFPSYFVSAMTTPDICHAIGIMAVSSGQNCGTILWGHMATVAAILITMLAPMCGNLADRHNNCKQWTALFTMVTIISAMVLWYAQPGTIWVWLTLIAVCINMVAIELTFIFYNAILPSITKRETLGRISSISWATGYFGSIVALVGVLVLFVLPEQPWLIDSSEFKYIRITGPLTALWLALFALPFFLYVPERIQNQSKQHYPLSQCFTRAWSIKGMIQYLMARMLIADALTTAFAFGGILASTVHGFSSQEVLMLGIGLNLSAGIGGMALSGLSDWVEDYYLVVAYTLALLITGIYITFAHNTLHFWIAGLSLSFFIGPIQAATRTVFAKMCPEQHTAELFGLYMFSGKATSFLGPLIYTSLIYYTGSQRLGMLAVMVILSFSLVLLLTNRSLLDEASSSRKQQVHGLI